MFRQPYVIVRGGRVVEDYLTKVIDLDLLSDDPALVDDDTRIRGLYGLLEYLRSEGEPVEPYVEATREWLEEYRDAHDDRYLDDPVVVEEEG